MAFITAQDTLSTPIAKPFLQFTSFIIATGLLNTIQNNIAQRDDRPTTANLTTC